jgi:uncharacterized protein
MRIVLFVGTLIALAFLGYITIVGYFLAHTTSDLLKVGAISSVLRTQESPTDPLALGYRGNPMEAWSLPFRIVQLETPLGPAPAWLVPAEGTEAGRAIYVHGIAGAREDGYRHLTMLHDAGWSVLLISYRNDEDAPLTADGNYGFGLSEWPDLEAAVAMMAPGPDGPGVLVVAESMGGAILGQFLAQSDLAGRVTAVALDSPALSFSAFIDHLARQGDKPLSGLVSQAAALILPQMTGLDLGSAEVSGTFATFPGPLFIAHGAGDRIVPVAPSQALAAARADTTVMLWTGADHLGSYAEDPDAYRTAFTAFLQGLNG